MGLGRGSHCFVWGSLAAVLYAGPANPEQDVATAAARVEVSAALADSDAAPTAPDLTAARDERDPDALLASPPVRIAVVTPEANANAREAADECVLSQECIDQYLWLIYDRARKLDTVKVKDRIKATVKKKGKTRTVTKTVTKLVDEDFTWKDPQAAEKAGMSMIQYVIGGMDRSFKLRLYRLFRAMDDAGLAPGMTSGFRDDYRQAIASGNKAASDSSFHGGSRRRRERHGQYAWRAMDFQRSVVEVGRLARQGIRDRQALPRQRSTAHRTDRRPGICRQARRESEARGTVKNKRAAKLTLHFGLPIVLAQATAKKTPCWSLLRFHPSASMCSCGRVRYPIPGLAGADHETKRACSLVIGAWSRRALDGAGRIRGRRACDDLGRLLSRLFRAGPRVRARER